MAIPQPPERPHEVVKLETPIREGGEKGTAFIDTVFVCRPRAKEMRLVPANIGAAGSMFGELFPFAQKLCGLTALEFDQLDVEDLTRIMEVVGGFLEKYPPDGPSSSSDSPGSSTSDAQTS